MLYKHQNANGCMKTELRVCYQIFLQVLTILAERLPRCLSGVSIDNEWGAFFDRWCQGTCHTVTQDCFVNDILVELDNDASFCEFENGEMSGDHRVSANTTLPVTENLNWLHHPIDVLLFLVAAMRCGNLSSEKCSAHFPANICHIPLQSCAILSSCRQLKYLHTMLAS